MKKSNGYYMRSYLKNNWLVLLCELVIILLLALICTVVMEGKPAWLTPTMAVTAYLLAEVRFMMAYVATIASKAQNEDEEQGEEELEQDTLPPLVSEPEMVEEPCYPDEAQEDCVEQVEEEQEVVESVEQETQDNSEIETVEKVELPDEPVLYLEAEPEEPNAQDADFDVQVEFSWENEPNTADTIVISDEDTDLPASKTLDLDEDI